MNSSLPSGDLTVVWVIVPISVLLVSVLIAWCCYRHRKLCFARKKDELLLPNSKKKRYTIDLTRKRRRDSFITSKSESFEAVSPVNGQYSGENNFEAYVATPIAHPSITHTVPIGQLKSKRAPPSNITSSAQHLETAKSAQHLVEVEKSNAEETKSRNRGILKRNVPRVKIQHQRTLSLEDIPDSSNKPVFRASTPTFHSKPFTSTHRPIHELRGSGGKRWEEDFKRSGLKKTKITNSDHLQPVDSKQVKMLSIKPNDTPRRRKSFDVQALNYALQPSFNPSSSAHKQKRFSIAVPTLGIGNKRGSPHRLSPSASPKQETLTEFRISKYEPRRDSWNDPIDPSTFDPRLYQEKPEVSSDHSRNSESDDEQNTRIHCKLQYDEDALTLAVDLIEATNLPKQEDSGTTDPYCTLRLKPLFTERKTKILRRTCNPKFEERFVFTVDQSLLEESTLEIKTFHHEQFSRDECNGIMELKMKEINFNPGHPVTIYRNLHPILQAAHLKDGACYGDLIMRISYIRSAERLTVTFQRARSLHLVDEKEAELDIYIKACLYKGTQVFKTKNTRSVRDGRHPTFDEALSFNIPLEVLQASDTKLICYVKHKSKLGHNINLGYLELSAACEDMEAKSHWDEMISQMLSPNRSKPVARWHHLKSTSSSLVTASGEVIPKRESIPDIARRKSLAFLDSFKLHST